MICISLPDDMHIIAYHSAYQLPEARYQTKSTHQTRCLPAATRSVGTIPTGGERPCNARGEVLCARAGWIGAWARGCLHLPLSPACIIKNVLAPRVTKKRELRIIQ